MIISKVENTSPAVYKILTHDDQNNLTYQQIKTMAESGSLKFFYAKTEIEERWPEELI